jgi:hypothetical protein
VARRWTWGTERIHVAIGRHLGIDGVAAQGRAGVCRTGAIRLLTWVSGFPALPLALSLRDNRDGPVPVATHGEWVRFTHEWCDRREVAW